MSGLRSLCRLYGAVKINGTMWFWDYAIDQAVTEDEMPLGSERWYNSEKRKFEFLKQKRN